MTYESLASSPAFILLKSLSIVLIIFVIAVTGILMTGFMDPKNKLYTRQRDFINNYPFKDSLLSKFAQTRPALTPEQQETVFKGLRDYFLMCHQAQGRMVSMPSQVVDEAWHSFILFTQDYQDFCQSAFGRFLHHTPAEVMTSTTKAQRGIKLAWRLACTLENINPKSPNELPLIFAIDSLLNIENGYYYRLDCLAEKALSDALVDSLVYCGTHIGCAGGCGGGCNDGSMGYDDYSGHTSSDGHHGCDEGCSSSGCSGSCSSGGCSSSSCGGGCGGGCGGS